MEETPTPNTKNSQLYIEQKIISDKKKEYLVIFKSKNDSEIYIEATNNNLCIKKTYSNTFTLYFFQNNKYFYQFDNMKEIWVELSERIEEKKTSLIENEPSVLISIPLPSTKITEIILELNGEVPKTESQIINEIIPIINEQKKEILIMKNEVEELKKTKDDFSFLLNSYILDLESVIIDNSNYNTLLKNWINPNKKIKANLLYRLSKDGPEISTFHQLCDEKGPTLTLFHLKDDNKIGFFINDCFDSVSDKWKTDDNCFIFNLKENKKYKKKKGLLAVSNTFYSGSECGPNVNGLGCNDYEKLDVIYFSSIMLGNVFENGSKILPPISIVKKYEVFETEIFQIIIH